MARIVEKLLPSLSAFFCMASTMFFGSDMLLVVFFGSRLGVYLGFILFPPIHPTHANRMPNVCYAQLKYTTK